MTTSGVDVDRVDSESCDERDCWCRRDSHLVRPFLVDGFAPSTYTWGPRDPVYRPGGAR